MSPSAGHANDRRFQELVALDEFNAHPFDTSIESVNEPQEYTSHITDVAAVDESIRRRCRRHRRPLLQHSLAVNASLYTC
jgi:hypothetical protein